jgi:hypothetical protein
MVGSGQFAPYLLFSKPDAVSAGADSGPESVVDLEAFAGSGCRSSSLVGRVDSSQSMETMNALAIHGIQGVPWMP